MKKDEFIEFAKKNGRIECVDCGDFVEVKDLEFNTTTRINNDAISENDAETLLKACHHGKNVKRITRITGYFSVVENWNAGKRAELKDRMQSKIE